MNWIESCLLEITTDVVTDWLISLLKNVIGIEVSWGLAGIPEKVNSYSLNWIHEGKGCIE